MAVKYYIDKRTDRKGDAPIRVSIIIKGARYLTSTGYKVIPSKWDADKQQARKGTANAAGITGQEINAALARITAHFAAIDKDALLNNTPTGIEGLKAEFAREFGRQHTGAVKAAPERTPQFWDYYKEFITERSVTNQWTRATFQKFNALKKHITGWREQPTFDDFT
ncbi:MAG: Arm DNA-binding domain-containing protein, partial [Muribaculaceae bacterium]